MAEVFVGRSVEQDEFRRVLELVGTGRRWPWVATSRPDEGHLVLIYGLGGIGKTTLLKRFHQLAVDSHRSRLVGDIVDLEVRPQGSRSVRVDPPAWEVMDAVYMAIRSGARDHPRALGRVSREFAGFRRLMTRQPELMERARELGISATFGRRRLSTEEMQSLTAATSSVAGLAAGFVPGAGGLVAPLSKTFSAALEASGGRRAGRVDNEAYDALIGDLDRLILEFAAAVKRLSQRYPIILFVDTGELVGGGFDWLRQAIHASGSRVVWVLSLRLEAELDASIDSEAVRFRRYLHDERLRSMPLTSFDDRTVEEYLRSKLRDKYPESLDIDAVMALTRGIPLAVWLLSRLLMDDASAALTPLPDGNVSEVVRELARRYLVHARTVPALQPDLPLLLGLALLHSELRSGIEPFEVDRRPGTRSLDVDGLSMLWNVPPAEVAANIERLAGRHDFVLTGKRRLHQDVRETILLSLLGESERLSVLEMNQRAAAHYRSQTLGRGFLTVDEQVEDASWRAAAIALLWHTFWVNTAQGLKMLKEAFGIAIALDSGFASALLQPARFFVEQFAPRDRALFDELEQVALWPWRAGVVSRSTVQSLSDALEHSPSQFVFASQPSGEADVPLLHAFFHESLGLTVPQRANLLVRAAKGMEGDSLTTQAVAKMARVLSTSVDDFASASSQTRQIIAAGLDLIRRFAADDSSAQTNLAYALAVLGYFEEAVSAAGEAVRLNPESAVSHNNLAASLLYLDRYVEAEAAYRDALLRDPNYAQAHAGLGTSLVIGARYVEAEIAYREALRCDPDYVIALNNLGFLLMVGPEVRFEEARDLLQLGIDLDPNYLGAHLNLAALQVRVGDTEAARTELTRAVELLPTARAEVLLGALALSGDEGVARAHFGSALAILDDEDPQPQAFGSRLSDAETRALALLGLGHAEPALDALAQGMRFRTGRDIARPWLYDYFRTPERTSAVDLLLEIWDRDRSA